MEKVSKRLILLLLLGGIIGVLTGCNISENQSFEVVETNGINYNKYVGEFNSNAGKFNDIANEIIDSDYEVDVMKECYKDIDKLIDEAYKTEVPDIYEESHGLFIDGLEIFSKGINQMIESYEAEDADGFSEGHKKAGKCWEYMDLSSKMTQESHETYFLEEVSD